MSDVEKGSEVNALWKKKMKEKEWLDLICKRQPATKALGPTLAETSKDVLIGAVAGSYLGTTVFGRYSFWAGLAFTLAGHASGWNMASSLGIGIMASGGKSIVGVNGTEDMEGFSKEAFKARNSAFVESWKEKLAPGIPKFGKKKEEDSEEKPVGELNVFRYPEYKEFSGLADLDRLEAELMDSARNFQSSTSMSRGDFGAADFSERIY